MACRHNPKPPRVVQAIAGLICVALLAPDARAVGIRIMPLGDSITRGLIIPAPGMVPGGYRTDLYNLLVNDGGWYQVNGVDFVGTASDNPDPFPPVAPDTDWLPDPDHEGHGGWRIDEIAANIGSYLTAANPALVLMHLGTNDVAQDYNLATAPARLDSLITQIATLSPQTRVVVAQIIGSTNAGEDAQIQAFNSALPAIVTAQQAAGRNVTLVNAYSAVSMANMADLYHPDKTGYDQLAAAWFSAVQALGNVTNPAPGPGGTILQSNVSTGSSEIAYPADGLDLIQAGASTLAAATHTDFAPFSYNGTTSTAALNDGLLGSDGVNSDTAFDLDGTWTSVYDLNTVLNPAGYDITEIRTIAGWQASRASQKFGLGFSFVGDPAFVDYGTFAYSTGISGSSMVTLTDSSGRLATGVDAIRFLFQDPGVVLYDETVYREVDVFGYATGSSSPPGATIVQSNLASGVSQMAFPASSTDLIQAGSATLAGATHDAYASFTWVGTSSTAALNDGLLGDTNTNSDTAFDLDGVWTSTFALNTALSPAGYDITEIRTIAGWLADRADQRFELQFSLVGSALFTSYGIFAYDPGLGGASMVTLTDSTGVIASGVDAVRFLIMVPGFHSGDETVYREFDVFGRPTPEPASLLTLVAAVAQSAGRRRR